MGGTGSGTYGQTLGRVQGETFKLLSKLLYPIPGHHALSEACESSKIGGKMFQRVVGEDEPFNRKSERAFGDDTQRVRFEREHTEARELAEYGRRIDESAAEGEECAQ